GGRNWFRTSDPSLVRQHRYTDSRCDLQLQYGCWQYPDSQRACGRSCKTAGDDGMDIADMWRSMRSGSDEVPRPGAHLEAAGQGITITVTQECQVALPLSGSRADEVTVTVTSQRPGVAAQVNIGANLNSPDGSYQGPTTTVGQGQFTATDSEVQAGFVVLP